MAKTGRPRPRTIVDDDPTALGPCCICEATGPIVRNVMLLPQRSPTPGKGWGCFQCGLPPDGAIAVVCEKCATGVMVWAPTNTELLPSKDPIRQRLRFVCVGWPRVDGRIPIGELDPTPFDHDPAFHPELAELALA